MICSRCGTEFKREKYHRPRLCNSCANKYHNVDRKAYQLNGVSYNAYQINKSNFPEGTSFIRTTSKGHTQHYTIKNGRLSYKVVGKSCKFKKEDLINIYEWLKKNQPVKPYQIAELLGRKSVGNILDALDREGYLTSEDEGFIYAYNF